MLQPLSACPDYLSFDPATRRLNLDPHEPCFVQNPYEAYAYLHAVSPTFFWEEYGFWCLSAYADVNGLFRDKRFGREKPGGYLAYVGARDHLAAFDRLEASSLLELEPPVHTRLRGLVNRAFVSRQVERLRPRIEALSHSLIDAFEKDGEADLLPGFATPLPITIIAEMLGVPVEMGEQMLDWSHRMVMMYMHRPTPEVAADANRASAEFSLFIRDHARKRRGAEGDDLLSLLLTAQADGDRLSEDELVASAILLLNAGHEATVHQAGNAVRAILMQGGEPGRFFATPEACEATVEECLRFDAPLHMFTRWAKERAEIAEGLTIEPGQQIALLLGAANRDPSSFAEPQGFLPSRADQKNVSFGAGIHFCIGAPLARLELLVALCVLFERLPKLRLVEEPRFRDSYHFHGLETLRCRWD
ncbi:MAG: cytochrome P450 [Methylobacterium mesophilicum]|nr:cytochrome P450 [Methylobacterium mesophilicum]